MYELEWGRAVCYSGYRENQSPQTGTFPTKEQIKEDLEIIAKDGFKYIRMYDACEYPRLVCQVIRENNLPIKLMLGPGNIAEVDTPGCQWNPAVYTAEEKAERAARNDSKINELIDIANEYSDVVFCVSVGNENTPDWGENTVPEERLCEFARRLREGTGKPVTFNEGANEWPKLKKLVAELDFICIHSYPLWYGLTIDDAIEANKKDYAKVKECYPDKQVIFSEVGWSTSTLPNAGMVNDQPTVENAAKYYKDFWAWTDSEKITAFMFEMFDEPWKGGNNPQESEKNWGIYYVDRTPKFTV